MDALVIGVSLAALVWVARMLSEKESLRESTSGTSGSFKERGTGSRRDGRRGPWKAPGLVPEPADASPTHVWVGLATLVLFGMALGLAPLDQPLSWRIIGLVFAAWVMVSWVLWLPWARTAGTRHVMDFLLFATRFLPTRIARGGSSDVYVDLVARRIRTRTLENFGRWGAARLAASLYLHDEAFFSEAGAQARVGYSIRSGGVVVFRLHHPDGIPLARARDLWRRLAESGLFAHALGMKSDQVSLVEEPGGEVLVARLFDQPEEAPTPEPALVPVRDALEEGAEADMGTSLNEGLPPLEVVAAGRTRQLDERGRAGLESLAGRAIAALSTLGKVKLSAVDVVAGPAVLRLLVRVLDRGVGLGQLQAQAKNLAGALNVGAVRIAPAEPLDVPKGVAPGNLLLVEIALPDNLARPVDLATLLARSKVKGGLPVVLGVAPDGRAVTADLATFPHLLVAGTTGSGKSMFLHGILCQFLLRFKPEQLRLFLVDPKAVEFTVYAGVPHLAADIVTTLPETIGLLENLIKEMESRYNRLRASGARDVAEYTGRDPMPRMVLVVDEFADLIASGRGADREAFEMAVQRLAQKARAAGIHLILSTQRPTREAIPPIIKANMPARVALRCTSELESRVVLDKQGAEVLRGQGDMLFLDPGGRVQRAQGPFVPPDAVRRMVEWWRENAPADGKVEDLDALWEAVVRWIEDRLDQFQAEGKAVRRPDYLAATKDVVWQALAAYGHRDGEPFARWAEAGLILGTTQEAFTRPVRIQGRRVRMVVFRVVKDGTKVGTKGGTTSA